MRRNKLMVLLLAALSLISGYLMSKASLIGKAGMSLFYREYNFLKVWWKGALLVFGAFLLLFIVQLLLYKRSSGKRAKALQLILWIMCIAGLYFTYNDFRHTLSHRLLGERFHLGVYLFWLGWMSINIFYLLPPEQDDPVIPTQENEPLQGI